MKKIAKFKVGDKVRVINYGHPFWSWEKMEFFKLLSKKAKGPYWYDMNPELVGQEGTVDKVTLTQGLYQYAIGDIPAKHAWYDEKQLENVLPASED